MTTTTKAARSSSAHNGAEHDGDQDTATQTYATRTDATQHDGEAATDAALAGIVIETVAAALREASTVAGEMIANTAVAVESAAGMAQGRMSGGVAAAVKKVAGLTLDTYQQVTTQQLAIAIVIADRVPVEWVSELTHRNAEAIGELVAVSAGAAHELLE